MKTYDLILENMTILTMDAAGTMIEDGIIGIENGNISLIEKKKSDVNYPANKRIDAKGMIGWQPSSTLHLPRILIQPS